MIQTLILPQILRDQIASEARAAHPRECCGLIEGIYKEEARQTLPLREGRKIRQDFSGRGQICCNLDPSPKNSSLRSEFYRPSLKGRVRNTIEDGESDTEADVIACHPIRNLAQTNDRFELDPAQHIQLLKALRGTGRTIIGCYHSHPNGRAEPSATDLSNAAAENFLWLIATDNTLSAFIHSAGAFHPIRLA